ncbi:hypothetical protein ACOSQ3_007880 [Xanthoceras sorbifolium]
MSSKIATVALLVMCLVFVAAKIPHVPKVEADVHGDCFSPCLEKCDSDGGQGYTFCEMKCDTDCFNKDVAAKLHIKFPDENINN